MVLLEGPLEGKLQSPGGGKKVFVQHVSVLSGVCDFIRLDKGPGVHLQSKIPKTPTSRAAAENQGLVFVLFMTKQNVYVQIKEERNK